MVKHTSEGNWNVASFKLNGRLNTNIAALTIREERGGRSLMAAGTKEGKLILWSN
jgi:hypothetical protein